MKASPQIQSNLYNHVDYAIRYDNYMEALVYLDGIANDPSLNEQQKKVVNQVIELVKAKLQAPKNAPAK